VIRYLLTERLSERSFKLGRRIEWQEVAAATGIHRATLSRMLNQWGYNATTSNLDSLCRYFDCALGEIAVYVPDEQVEAPVNKTYKGPKPIGGRP
jgi:putative transcriptional regulator